MLPASTSALPSRHESARTLACLFIGGGAIGLGTTVLLAPPRGIALLGVVLPSLGALIAGAILWSNAARIPPVAVPLAVAFGTAIISVALYFGSDIPTRAQIMYLSVGGYAF